MISSIAILALLAASTQVRAQQCTSPTQTIALCCESLGKFSDNSYVWTGVCGKTGVAPDTPTASFCGAPGTCYDNIIPVCCESTFVCGYDGPVGLNCSRVEA